MLGRVYTVAVALALIAGACSDDSGGDVTTTATAAATTTMSGDDTTAPIQEADPADACTGEPPPPECGTSSPEEGKGAEAAAEALGADVEDLEALAEEGDAEAILDAVEALAPDAPNPEPEGDVEQDLLIAEEPDLSADDELVSVATPTPTSGTSGRPARAFVAESRRIADAHASGESQESIADLERLFRDAFPSGIALDGDTLGADWRIEARYGRDTNGNGIIDMPNTTEYVLAPLEVDFDFGSVAELLPARFPSGFGSLSDREGGSYQWRITIVDVPQGPTAQSGLRSFAGGTLMLRTNTPEMSVNLYEGLYDIEFSRLDDQGEVYSVLLTDIRIEDILIVQLGDSYGSGEGAPERHDKSGVWGDGGGPTTRDLLDLVELMTCFKTWQSDPIDEQCLAEVVWGSWAGFEHELAHRSSNTWGSVAAQRIEAWDPRTSVTFVNLAATGARIEHLIDKSYEAVYVDNVKGWDEILKDDRGWVGGPAIPHLKLDDVSTYLFKLYLRSLGWPDAAIGYTGCELCELLEFVRRTQASLPPQLVQLDGILGDRTPDAVVVSVGGNDAGFGKAITAYKICGGHNMGSCPAGDRVEIANAMLSGDWSSIDVDDDIPVNVMSTALQAGVLKIPGLVGVHRGGQGRHGYDDLADAFAERGFDPSTIYISEYPDAVVVQPRNTIDSVSITEPYPAGLYDQNGLIVAGPVDLRPDPPAIYSVGAGQDWVRNPHWAERCDSPILTFSIGVAQPGTVISYAAAFGVLGWPGVAALAGASFLPFDGGIGTSEQRDARQFLIWPLNAAVHNAALRHGWNLVGDVASAQYGRPLCDRDTRLTNTYQMSMDQQGDQMGTAHPTTDGFGVTAEALLRTIGFANFVRFSADRVFDGARELQLVRTPTGWRPDLDLPTFSYLVRALHTPVLGPPGTAYQLPASGACRGAVGSDGASALATCDGEFMWGALWLNDSTSTASTRDAHHGLLYSADRLFIKVDPSWCPAGMTTVVASPARSYTTTAGNGTAYAVEPLQHLDNGRIRLIKYPFGYEDEWVELDGETGYGTVSADLRASDPADEFWLVVSTQRNADAPPIAGAPVTASSSYANDYGMLGLRTECTG